ncbi:MAG: hypothetical protein P4M00_04125 [Azospirillaceae bacterium]|nr:hypothetical protein [Azospirillaceae bacterium]
MRKTATVVATVALAACSLFKAEDLPARPIEAAQCRADIVLPHVSTELDGTHTPFISALALLNTSGDPGPNTVTLCAYTTDGTFLGGGAVDLAPNQRIYATTSPPSPGTVSLSALVNNAILGERPFQLHLGVTKPIAPMVGFAGNKGQLIALYQPVQRCETGNCSNTAASLHFAHLGHTGGIDSVIYIANPSVTKSQPVDVIFRSDNGQILKTVGTRTLAPASRIAIDALQFVNDFGSVSITTPDGGSVAAVAAVVYQNGALGGSDAAMVTPTTP